MPGELAAAAAAGDNREVQILLEAGANPNEPDTAGQTALLYAVASGNYAMTDLILNMSRTDPDIFGPEGMNALLLAVAMSREDLVVRLLEAGADAQIVGDGPEGEPVSPLSLAVNRGEFELAWRLFKHGANPKRLVSYDTDRFGLSPLRLPVLQNDFDLFLWRNIGELRDWADSPDWRKNTSQTAAVLCAARDNRWKELRSLLDAGAAVDGADEHGVSPMMSAAYFGHVAVVRLLQQRGASVEQTDSKGRNALCYAAAAGETGVIKQLLNTPAYIIKDPAESAAVSLEQSPLFYALAGKRPANLPLLVKAGFPLDIVDSEGITLLMAAAWLGNESAVRLLLDNSDSEYAARMDMAGRTALEWSLAAFIRDRKTGRESSRPERGKTLYPVVRMLARREYDPSNYQPQPALDVHPAVVAAWFPGGRSSAADEWRLLRPSPVPEEGDGDLTIHRILRDEEPG